MLQLRRHNPISFTLAALLATVAVGATPTTKPTTTKPAKLDPSLTMVVNDEFHYQFAVPKAWKKMQASGPIVAYQLPMAGQTAGRPAIFTVIYGKACHPGASLATQIEAEKTGLTLEHKDFKPAKDEAATLGGEPAWTLVYDDTSTVTETMIKNGQQSSQKITDKIRVMKTIVMKDGACITTTYDAKTADFDAKTKAIEKVLASWQWTGEPADTADVTK